MKFFHCYDEKPIKKDNFAAIVRHAAYLTFKPQKRTISICDNNGIKTNFFISIPSTIFHVSWSSYVNRPGVPGYTQTQLGFLLDQDISLKTKIYTSFLPNVFNTNICLGTNFDFYNFSSHFDNVAVKQKIIDSLINPFWTTSFSIADHWENQLWKHYIPVFLKDANLDPNLQYTQIANKFFEEIQRQTRNNQKWITSELIEFKCSELKSFEYEVARMYYTPARDNSDEGAPLTLENFHYHDETFRVKLNKTT